jgi:hypothetical protein
MQSDESVRLWLSWRTFHESWQRRASQTLTIERNKSRLGWDVSAGELMPKGWHLPTDWQRKTPARRHELHDGS